MTASLWDTVGLAGAAAFVITSGIAAVAGVLGYARRPLDGGPSWLTRWDVEPGTMAGNPLRLLFLASAAGLFLELLMIRWISSEIRIFAYFKNLVLIACYLGFGMGCFLARRRVNLLALLVPLLGIALLVKLPWPELRRIMLEVPSLIGVLSGVDVWGVPNVPDVRLAAPKVLAALAAIMPFFALIALAFMPIGQLVGWYIETSARGIRAYSVNVAGSLVGILLYTALCFLDQPPAVWLAAAGVLVVLVVGQRARFGLAAGAVFAAAAGLALLSTTERGQTFWSPYQKLTLSPVIEYGDTTALELGTNDTWFQQIVNLSPAYVAAHPDRFAGEPAERNPYNLPYQLYPNPSAVLVLGAGMGNDVAAAVRNGARSIVAVEIDPLILDLGRRLHFERPYQSERVRVVVNDARSYVENTRDRFDLILYSLLDSHTTSSHFTNIRIDNYVYTREALRAAKQLLGPDGLLVLKFQVNQPWIAGRLHALLRETFDVEPVRISSATSHTGTGGSFFVVGNGERFTRAKAVVAERALGGSVPMASASPTTDDWPYFYQHEPGLPASVIVVSLALALLGWRLLRATTPARQPMHWHFFMLGAAFLLLEAQIVSRMALLFGTTWVVNSIVIAGLLGLILLANAVIEARPAFPPWVAYAGMFGSIAIGYLIPVHTLVSASIVVRLFVATLVLCLPVFFAGIAFIQSFAAEQFRSEVLGANLFGALVGGLLEALSLWTGLRSLLLLAAAFYAIAWLTRPRAAATAQVTSSVDLRAGAA